MKAKRLVTLLKCSEYKKLSDKPNQFGHFNLQILFCLTLHLNAERTEEEKKYISLKSNENTKF